MYVIVNHVFQYRKTSSAYDKKNTINTIHMSTPQRREKEKSEPLELLAHILLLNLKNVRKIKPGMGRSKYTEVASEY